MKYRILFFGAMFFLTLYIAWMWTSKIQVVRDFHQIAEEKTLKVVTEYSSAGYYVSGDSIAGFQYELCKALEEHFGWKVEFFLENNLASSLLELKTQKYDLIARNIPITTENREDILFTDPILLDHQILVQRTAKCNQNIPPIRNQLDLGKKTLHVPEDSPGILRLRNLSEEIADTIYIIEEKQYAAEQLIYMVAKGDIDFAVVDYQTAQRHQKNHPELDIETDIGFTQIQSWAIRKDSPVLFDSINTWLKIFKTSKAFEAIQKKYL